MKHISIKEAAIILGITTTTLRRWHKSGKFTPSYRTFGNHRRYELLKVLELIIIEIYKKHKMCF